MNIKEIETFRGLVKSSDINTLRLLKRSSSTKFFEDPSRIGTSSESISINKLSTPFPYKAAIKCSIVETDTPYSFEIFVQ